MNPSRTRIVLALVMCACFLTASTAGVGPSGHPGRSSVPADPAAAAPHQPVSTDTALGSPAPRGPATTVGSPSSHSEGEPTVSPDRPVPVTVPTTGAGLPEPREIVSPTRLRISSVGIDLPVVPTGVAEDGTMAIPATVSEVGWYRFGGQPGASAGTTVLAAHVDTRAEGLGPFASLAALREGDPVTVETSAGRTVAYTVKQVERISRTKLPVNDLFRVSGAPELVLITCGGAYDRSTGYHDNVVVTGNDHDDDGGTRGDVRTRRRRPRRGRPGIRRGRP